MNKRQAVIFWKDLRESKNATSSIRKYKGKAKFGKTRTLGRFVQVDKGFTHGDNLEELAQKTGWSVKQTRKVHSWWLDEFQKDPVVDGDLSKSKEAVEGDIDINIAGKMGRVLRTFAGRRHNLMSTTSISIGIVLMMLLVAAIQHAAETIATGKLP